MQMQHSVSEVKFDLRHKNGSLLPIVLNGIRRQEGNQVVHDLAAFVARDRDKYERELIASGKRLQELASEAAKLEELAKDRALFSEQMMGIVSHDLRNPLAVVEMSALGVGSLGVSDEQRKALDRIHRATDRASRLIRELLDFTQARIGEGLAVQIRRIDLSAVLRDALDELRHAFPESTLTLVADRRVFGDADADRITQMVGNLVANAIAYGTPDRPITVRLEADEHQLVVSVHNEGRPIPSHLLPQLFQPMTRGHQAPGGGRSVGLGLYIVSEIAKAHRGGVEVQSTLEEGTTFRALLPRGLVSE